MMVKKLKTMTISSKTIQSIWNPKSVCQKQTAITHEFGLGLTNLAQLCKAITKMQTAA
jgi:hypothetical protein